MPAVFEGDAEGGGEGPHSDGDGGCWGFVDCEGGAEESGDDGEGESEEDGLAEIGGHGAASDGGGEAAQSGELSVWCGSAGIEGEECQPAAAGR